MEEQTGVLYLPLSSLLPPPAVGGARLRRDPCEQPVTSVTFREEPDLSAALLSFSTSTAPLPPPPLSSSSAPSCCRAQHDAGGVYHGGVRRPHSGPTRGGGHLGTLGRPLPTPQNSQTGGRSISLAGCFWFCVPDGTGSVALSEFVGQSSSSSSSSSSSFAVVGCHTSRLCSSFPLPLNGCISAVLCRCHTLVLTMFFH